MILSSILTGLAGKVLGNAFASAERLWTAYLNKEISKEQYDAEKVRYIQQASAEIEEAWAEATADIYAEAQKTLRDSFTAPSWVTRNSWAFVVLSQTIVLIWYQIGLPVYVYVMDVPLTGSEAFPRTGDDLLMWAYALVGAALGIGVWQMRKR